MLAHSLVMFCAFLPFFALREIERALGEGRLADLFFRSGASAECDPIRKPIHPGLRAKCRRPTAADNAPLRPASAAASILCVPPRTTAPLCRAWPRTGFALGRPTCAATAPRALFAPSHPRRLLEPFEFRHYHRGGPCKPSIQGTLDDENFGLAGYLDA